MRTVVIVSQPPERTARPTTLPATAPPPHIRPTTPGLETNKQAATIVDENEMSTRENVFAGGDAVTGAATVILAMGAGKKAAEAIDRKLQNK